MPFASMGSEGRERSILAIDDQSPNLRLLQRIFSKQQNVRLLTASTGQEGLELARSQQPDLILLDLNLPDHHGADLLGQLQRDERTWTIPVIMLSGEHADAQIQGLLEEGAVAYITKPFDLQQLLDTVSRVLEIGR